MSCWIDAPHIDSVKDKEYISTIMRDMPKIKNCNHCIECLKNSKQMDSGGCKVVSDFFKVYNQKLESTNTPSRLTKTIIGSDEPLFTA